jgi:EAL domain-containing protein (putative c-di-GMP-specific phosphodiesterase class I)/GGDEF domain-containing protein
MSLYKQLWLSICLLVALTFIATLAVTSLTARHYLQHQLHMKNVDNASALALSVRGSRALGESPVAMLEEQFRHGHYELIELRDAGGELLHRSMAPRQRSRVPAWFARMMPIEVAPGTAQLRAGDEVLTVVSRTDFAYQALWSNLREIAGVFLVTALVAGALGTFLLRLLLRPLRQLAEQATAIGDRRFITVSEPATTELREVARAMNGMSSRVRDMLQHESSRLEKWRKEAHDDELTGVLLRQHFLCLFESTLGADDADTSGVITLLRISNLAVLNQVHGRDTMNSVLSGFGKALQRFREHNSGVAVGRLSGSEFAVLTPREIDAGSVGSSLQRALREVLQERGLGEDITLPGASTLYRQGDTASELLMHLDSALLNAEQQGESQMVVMGRNGIQMMPVRQELKRWRSLLHHAFDNRQFFLASFPVVRLDGGILHHEAPARLDWRGTVFTAGQILPWIYRLDLAGELDRTVVMAALAEAGREHRPMSVNLSSASVADPGFITWLSDRLSANPEAAARLWLEVQESAVYRHLEGFRRLCTRCKRYGTRVGIEHLGHQLSDIGRLHDVGVDYVKVDSAFVRGVEDNPANQTLLRTLCTLVHSLGITAIAEGVDSELEWNALVDIGFDAATGPAVTARHHLGPGRLLHEMDGEKLLALA